MPFEAVAEIELRARDRPDLAGRPQRVPVALRSLSCEGAGVAWLDGARPTLARGATVYLLIHVVDQQVCLPGRVVWTGPRLGAQGCDLGMCLELAAVPARQRQRFAEWIVGLTQAHVARRQ